jgi:hypothetical protein
MNETQVKPVIFKGGEALPTVGSAEYKLAQQGFRNEQDLQNFANANPAQADVIMDRLGYSNVITPESLAPVAPLKVTNPKNATSVTNLGGVIDGIATGFETQQKADAQAKLEADKMKFDSSRQAIKDKIYGAKTQPGLMAEAYKTNVDPVKAELTDINTKIRNEQIGLQRQVENFEKTFQGTVEGRNTEIGRLQKESYRKQADLAIVQLALQGKYSDAKDIADRAVSAELEQQKNELEALKLDYQDNKDLYNKEEQRSYEKDIKDAEKRYARTEANKKGIRDIALEYLKNGGDSNTAANIMRQDSVDDAIGLAGSRLASVDTQVVKLDNGQSILIDSRTGNTIKTLGGGSGTTPSGNVSTIKELQGLPSEKKNNAVLTQLLTSQKIGQGTRTQVANVLGVINTVQSLADARQTSGFKGVSPFNAILDVKIPFTEIGIPFREAARQKEGVENVGYIEAINLKVQQWASGASLTKTQTEQVGRFTPRVTDTDDQVRTKLNNLANFMLEQAKSQLQSEGIDFKPEKVNLFETYELIQKASPEQLEELKASGLIQ